ncbi:protein CMSS1 [Neosynchiropus ocellatus]
MGDDLGDEWWTHESNSDVPEEEEATEPEVKSTTNITKKGAKRKSGSEKTVKAKKKKSNEQKEVVVPQAEADKSAAPKRKRKRKKKTITDVLASSEPKPGCPSDLQMLLASHFSDKRSVIEQEELKLADSCFLTSNDLTHSLSSYLKLVCPKWSKIQKLHTEKSSVVLLVVCSSALRTIQLIKLLTAFRGEAKVLKLFAKHIKVEEQVKLLQRSVTHVAVGTPGRISALVEREGLSLSALRYLVLDWNWRDQKLRRLVDIPEVKLDLLKLLDSGVIRHCREDKVKIGLF